MDTTLADLRRALDNEEMVPYFQPIVELRTAKLSGFEILARWQPPGQEATLPENLIHLAEANGLIGMLAQQILSRAFDKVAALPGALRLAINVSPLQLRYTTLALQIEQLATLARFPLDRLTVEITESALLTDLTRSQSTAHELKEIGCRLSLDDFGVGYSSLAHLQALPFDEIKIDRSFVSQMTRTRASRKIVAAIIGLGHSLGLTTVAEGIETPEHADMLLWLGSECGQGWHFGRPGSSDGLAAAVTKSRRPPAAGVKNPGDDWAVSSLEALPTQRLAQLQAIYEGAPIGLAFLDCGLHYVSMNQHLAQMNGHSVPDHLGKTVPEMVPDLYPQIASSLDRVLQGETVTGVELSLSEQKNSPAAWLKLSFQPAFDEADEVIGISLSAIDITAERTAQKVLLSARQAQQSAQKALDETEEMHRQLSELNHQVPWIMDPQGYNLKPSSTWVTDLPEVREKTRNLGWLEAVHLSDLRPTIRKMKRSLRTGQPIDMEYRIQDIDGNWRWMRSRGLPRLGPDGEITRWYGSVEDITEGKAAILALRRAEATMRTMQKNAPTPDSLRGSILLPPQSNYTATNPGKTSTLSTPASSFPSTPAGERRRLASMLEDFSSLDPKPQSIV